MKVIDRMSDELVDMQTRFANIDIEVEKDEKCVKLASEMVFFRD